MEIEQGDAQTVKKLSAPACRGRSRRHQELADMCLRFNGYLRGCFARGAWYKIWDKHQFHRATLSARPRQVSYIEHAFRVFMRTSTIYHFEKIRIGRSERIKVSLRGAPPIKLTQLEVSLRLGAYVTRAARTRGVAHVDGLFLERFAQTSGLPAEFIWIAWQRIKKIRGLRVRWRGTGAGKKFVASLPQIPTRHSSPTERRDRKSVVAPLRDDSSRSSAGLPAGKETAREQSHRRPPSLGATIHCADPPFQIAGRWISAKRLLALACWLAVIPMKAAHVRGWRVCWRYAHARNLAYRALRDGHAAAAIVDAWRRGVDHSHEDSLDRDRVPGGFASEPREPSAAVVYAWHELWRDSRTREQRWLELLESGQKRPRELLAVKLPKAPAGAPPAVRVKNAAVLEELRARLTVKFTRDEPAAAAPTVTQGELLAYLRSRGLSVAKFASLPYAMRQGYIRGCRLELEQTRQKGAGL